jgi:phospholipid/cholesterol/gamma-HCH transport system substrate-binding protein
MAVSREIKVGLFVFLGFIGAAAIIFMIGDNRSLFDPKVAYRAEFADVQGVKPGSTVRMGGVDIGTVSRVQYPEDPTHTSIQVSLSIVRREAPRIRQSSLASIAAKGLLGDKMVTISPGRAGDAALPEGSLIPSAPAEDFTQVLSQMGSITASARGVLTNLETATGTLAESEFQDDLRQGLHALSQILISLDNREGYVGRLLHDPAEAQRISSLLANLERTSARLDGVLASVDQVVDRINSGPGLAHEIIYSKGQAMAQIGTAAEELGKTLAGVREGNGLAHGLLFGDTGKGGDSALGDQLASDVAGMSQDLRAMVGEMRQGKGTLGALLVDPSVYEDLKMLLGNVQRNQVLRALVRYSIQRDDGTRGVEVVDPNDERNARDERALPAGAATSAGASSAGTSSAGTSPAAPSAAKSPASVAPPAPRAKRSAER